MLPCKLLRQCVTLIGLIFIISCDQTPEVSDALPEPVKNPVSNKEEIDPDAAPSSPNPESPTPPTTNPSSNPAETSNSNNGFVGDGGNSGGGGGGGSGGGGGEAASAVGPNGICGNGIQEVSPGAHNKCIYDLYGTTTNGPNGPSSLFFFANDTGVGYQIGVVSEETVGVERIGAIDFDSRGVLYGVGERSSDSKSVLLTIDCVTAQATIIGLTNIDSLFGSDAVITDIDIDAQGRFYAFSDSNTNPNVLGLLNPLTGAFTTIGAAGVALPNDDIGNGIASAPFPSSTLYHGGAALLSSLNVDTGVASTVDTLKFSAPIDNNHRINAMDHNAFFDITYVAVNDGIDGVDENYVAKLDRVDGTVSYLPQGPQLAPAGLDGLAVNQHYEECDPSLGVGLQNVPTLPLGTECDEACQIFEADCTDGLDNDDDGSIDCADPDCGNQACDDDLACTIDDVCVNAVCVGAPNPCIDSNPCSVDGVCIEPSGTCDFSQLEDRPNFGDCDVDGLACTIGKCVLSEGPFCFEQNMSLIAIEENGCLDDDPCTADGCVETPFLEIDPPTWSAFKVPDLFDTEAQCIHESLVGVLCQPGDNPCFQGVCTLTGEGTPSSPFDVQCLDVQPRDCGNNIEAELCIDSGC